MSLTQSRQKPHFRGLLRKILQSRAITQAELARDLDLEPSSVSLYLSGKREPDAFASLLIAGLLAAPEDRAAIVAAKVTDKQLALLANALCAESPRDAIPAERMAAATQVTRFLATAPASSVTAIMAIVTYFMQHPDPPDQSPSTQIESRASGRLTE